MSKKSRKRTQNRSKKQPVKFHSSKGGSAYAFPYLKRGTPLPQIRAAEQDKLAEQEALAFELGAYDDEIEAAHRELDEKVLTPSTSMDFWVSALDTPEDVVARVNNFPEILRQELIHDMLEPTSMSEKSDPRIRAIAGAALWLLLYKNNPICTPTGRQFRKGRPRKCTEAPEDAPKRARPDLTITPEDEERWQE